MLVVDISTFNKECDDLMATITLHLNFYPISKWVRKYMWYRYNSYYGLSINTPWIELRVDKWWRC